MGEISGSSTRPPAPWRRVAGTAAIRAGAALALSIALAEPAMSSCAGGDPSEIPGGTYRLDAQDSSLFAVVRYAGGLVRAKLRFTRLQGVVDQVQGDPGRTRVAITVDSTSADSGQSGFNRTIAASLGSARYPTIRFVSKGLSNCDERGGDLEGDLTLHGVTRPLRLRVIMQDVASADGGAARLRFSGKGRIRRSDYGVGAPGPLARDAVDLRFEVAFTRQVSR